MYWWLPDDYRQRNIRQAKSGPVGMRRREEVFSQLVSPKDKLSNPFMQHRMSETDWQMVVPQSHGFQYQVCIDGPTFSFPILTSPTVVSVLPWTTTQCLYLGVVQASQTQHGQNRTDFPSETWSPPSISYKWLYHPHTPNCSSQNSEVILDSSIPLSLTSIFLGRISSASKPIPNLPSFL